MRTSVVIGLLLLGGAARGEEPPPGTLAIVAGQPVSETELRASAGNRLVAIENQAYQGRERLLWELIDQRLLDKEAASRGLTVGALEAAEIDAKLPPPSDAEMAALREQNRERLAAIPEAQASQALRDAILNQHRGERRVEFIEELRGKAGVRLLIEPPRVTIAEADSPTLGPRLAPVTIVEFSDFQCPYCAQAVPVLKRVRETYGDKVRFVYRDFPLGIHANAGKAAEAGACAREQGKFWEMHDRLFADQGHLAVPDLKATAKSLGLDPAAFDSCLDSSRYEATWREESREAETYGVSGTPFFFVNGRMVNGAVPFSTLKALIDQELERAAPAPPAKKAAS